jgi:hypothetical protein
VKWLCLLLTLVSLRSLACEARLDVPQSVSISSWEAATLAYGEPSHAPLDVRVTARGCGELALGVGYEGELPAGVRSSPGGAWLGLTPGDRAPLLALSADLADGVDLQPVLAWRPQPQGLPPGAAAGNVRWRLYARDGLLERLVLERVSVVVANVPAVLSVQIGGAHGRNALGNGPTVLDLGRMESGAVHPLFIEVRGNGNARVSVLARHGQLRLRGRSGYSIPYTLRLDGRPISGAVPLVSPRSNGGIAIARLEVVVGDVERRAAGQYEDVLTLTVAAE